MKTVGESAQFDNRIEQFVYAETDFWKRNDLWQKEVQRNLQTCACLCFVLLGLRVHV